METINEIAPSICNVSWRPIAVPLEIAIKDIDIDLFCDRD